MMMFGQNFVSSLWMQAHMFFGAMTFLGLVMLVIYAAKFMKKGTLATWTIILIVLGVIGVFLTCGLAMDHMTEMMKLWQPK
jgi:uncharacterized membrane protein YobD (UPF0266 family)